MQKLSYQPEEYYPAGSAAGLVVLQTDEVLEVEIRNWLPNSIRLFHSRVPNDAIVTRETLAAMEAEIPKAVHLLPPSAGIGVVAYCCTSGSTVIGEDNVTAAVHKVMPDVKVTNPVTAVMVNLNHLGAKRIGLLTPYEPQVSNDMADLLRSKGFEISSFGAFGEKEDAKVTRISRKSILDAVELIGSGDQCDAVFASCTNLRVADILEEAATRIGKPVISSNSALAWHIEQLVNED